MTIGPSTFTSGVDFNIAGSGNASGLTFTKPSGLADGDYLFVWFQSQTGGGTITPPSGWTSVGVTVTSRTAQVFYKRVASAAAETATSYTFTATVTARIAGMIYRLSGVHPTNPVDVKATAETAGASGSVNVASLTATGAGFAMVFPFSNASSLTGGTFAFANGFTDSGIYGTGQTTGRTDVGMGFKQLTAAGAVGATAITGFNGTPNGFMVVLNPIVGGTLALSGSGALALTNDTNHGGPVTLAGTGTLALSGRPALSGAVAFTGTGALDVHQLRPVDAWIANRPMFTAHRGGSADWDEHTMFAYDQAAAWNKDLALEVSIWKSADGVWVVNHDNDPSVTGTWSNPGTGNITARNWAGDLQNIVSTHGFPMIRLVDLLAKYGSTRILVIDNKAAKDLTTTTVGLSFLDTLNAYAGNSRYILKSFYTGTTLSAFARTYGFKTWGYYYQSDVANIAATASQWDILGMEYGATSGWDAVAATGQPFWAHILPTAAAKAMADAHTVKPSGYMVSGVEEVVPQTPAVLTLAGGGALSASGKPAMVAPLSLSGAGVLSLTGKPGASGVLTLAGAGTLDLTGQASTAGALALSGAGDAAFLTAFHADGLLHLAGSGAMYLSAGVEPRDITVTAAGPFRNPMRDATPQGNPLRVTGVTR